MSFQAYLDTIKATTGMTPEGFKARAVEKGLLEPGVKTGQIVAWLGEDFGLGQGHAMAIINTLGQMKGAGLSATEKIADQFSRGKAHWRPSYDELVKQANEFGEVRVSPTNTYLSLLKGTKKFAIVQVTTDRLDVGIKLRGTDPTERLEPAGSWNSMVTHRVRLGSPDELDVELLSWLHRAYDQA